MSSNDVRDVVYHGDLDKECSSTDNDEGPIVKDSFKDIEFSNSVPSAIVLIKDLQENKGIENKSHVLSFGNTSISVLGWAVSKLIL